MKRWKEQRRCGRERGPHHEESRVHHSPGCGDDLASSSVERLLGDDCVQDFKLDIPDGWGRRKARGSSTLKKEKCCVVNDLCLGVKLTLITQRTLPGAPLEALNDAVFDWAEQSFVHLQGKTKSSWGTQRNTEFCANKRYSFYVVNQSHSYERIVGL